MRDPLRIGRLIGSGGEGSVYEHRSDPGMVIKVLHPQHATPERAAKLQAMRNNPPQNAQALSWPNAVEYDANGLRYQMPKASKGTGTAYRFISANERRQLPQHQQAYEYRTTIGVRIAEAFRGLHAIGVRIGDVNPSNILVRADGSVMLIDCDSFQIPSRPGHQPYPCVVGSPEYTAPEIDDFQRQFRSQDSDNFALAVLLYQLLGDGSHPYRGIDASAHDAVSGIRERIKGHRFAHNPQGGRWRPVRGQMQSWRRMPEPVRNAFQQAFSPMASHLGRPSADAWARILEENPNQVPAGKQRATPPNVSGSGQLFLKPQTPRPARSSRSPVRSATGIGETTMLRYLIPVLLVIAGIGAGAFFWYVSHDTPGGIPSGAVPLPPPTDTPTPTEVPRPTQVPETATPTSTPVPHDDSTVAPSLLPAPTLMPTITPTPTPDWPPQPLTSEWREWAKDWSRAEVNTALQESARDFILLVDSLKDLPRTEACSLVDELEMRLAIADYLVETHHLENATVPDQHAGLTWGILLRNRREALAETVTTYVSLEECRRLLATANPTPTTMAMLLGTAL